LTGACDTFEVLELLDAFLVTVVLVIAVSERSDDFSSMDEVVTVSTELIIDKRRCPVVTWSLLLEQLLILGSDTSLEFKDETSAVRRFREEKSSVSIANA
jgi:hypothetical protein